jgi:hypothetical protein
MLQFKIFFLMTLPIVAFVTNGAFALDVKLILNENLGGILDGAQC